MSIWLLIFCKFFSIIFLLTVFKAARKSGFFVFKNMASGELKVIEFVVITEEDVFEYLIAAKTGNTGASVAQTDVLNSVTDILEADDYPVLVSTASQGRVVLYVGGNVTQRVITNAFVETFNDLKAEAKVKRAVPDRRIIYVEDKN